MALLPVHLGACAVLLLTYLAVGAVAGVLAGLFGVGGGTIIVPALLLCFGWQDIDPALRTHLAIGTSLATIVITSVSSTWTHHRAGAVRWSLVAWLTPGLAAGVWAGAALAAGLAGLHLQRLFGLFAWLVAAQMAFDWKPGTLRELPRAGLLGGGTVIGLVSALFGIGGGSLTVPFLCVARVRMQEAVATAAACGFPIALVGALGYVFQGRAVAGLPDGASGFVYLPALAGIALTSLPCARIGARLAHRWSARRLQQVFAGFLLLIGGVLLAGIR